MSGQYYLHTNGSLIYKPHGGVEQDSTFVKGLWSTAGFDTPKGFMLFLKDAYRLGAKREEIEKLIERFNLDQYLPDCRESIYG